MMPGLGLDGKVETLSEESQVQTENNVVLSQSDPLGELSIWMQIYLEAKTIEPPLGVRNCHRLDDD